MINFYVYRIKKGKMTLEDIPLKWRAAVTEKLAEKEEKDN